MSIVGDHEADRARISALEAELAEVRQQIAELGTSRSAERHRDGQDDDHGGRPPMSRRGLIAGAAGVVAAGAAAVVATPQPAAANAQGESWTLGEFANSATSTTGLRGSNFDPVLLITNNGTSRGDAAQFYVKDPANTGACTHHETAGLGAAAEFLASNPKNTASAINVTTGHLGSAGSFVVSNTANSAAAVGVSTTGTGPAVSANARGGGNAGFFVANGTNAALYVTMSGPGYAMFINDTNTASTNPTVFVQGVAQTPALRVKSPMANINLWPRSAAGAPTADTVQHGAGDLVEDSIGNLWACVGGGTPGQWRKLAGPTAAGALHLLAAPVRVYDSRPGTAPAVGSKTKLASNVPRSVDLRANNSGVAAGATAAMVNLLIVNAPAANANFTLWKNGAARPSANTMVWGGDAGRFSTLAITALDAAGLAQVVSSVTTDIVIDVVGYYR